jgi:hypothetical protein
MVAIGFALGGCDRWGKYNKCYLSVNDKSYIILFEAIKNPLDAGLWWVIYRGSE